MVKPNSKFESSEGCKKKQNYHWLKGVILANKCRPKWMELFMKISMLLMVTATLCALLKKSLLNERISSQD
ncbi:hypothetical protein S4054249_20540 [Pseudoalteromonas luteoviolacea]|uniref:Uncharacterized protein n=1 Tax=Pseudoalteromonas luteoviolacea S4054 TaxID=1129367 RepID=A0A0F6AGF3_9GAMM|nr:hypothetical protein S4054249_20540 [Pseudoalteromonas luteoviolacea]AOT19881.1 hypothetical protein S4054_20515 [Pseudoalteromonas luteoviolacea]KKE84856.1 hypothetical protein N479_07095 [Pseudoalteromonas luteoviolacea S4054]KZN72473.1 hypothetical protein N481_14685 [Pseudoalteromonas luteoviolacea S4047-1]